MGMLLAPRVVFLELWNLRLGLVGHGTLTFVYISNSVAYTSHGRRPSEWEGIEKILRE